MTSRTQIWQYDHNVDLCPLRAAAGGLGNCRPHAQDANTGDRITIPARTSEIHIRMKPGLIDLDAASSLMSTNIVEAVLAQKQPDD